MSSTQEGALKTLTRQPCREVGASGWVGVSEGGQGRAGRGGRDSSSHPAHLHRAAPPCPDCSGSQMPSPPPETSSCHPGPWTGLGSLHHSPVPGLCMALFISCPYCSSHNPAREAPNSVGLVVDRVARGRWTDTRGWVLGPPVFARTFLGALGPG